MQPAVFLCPVISVPRSTPKPGRVSRQARLFYVAFARHFSSTSPHSASDPHFHRSDFANQPFTGSYEPNAPTTGPLAAAPILGVPRLTPKILKQHLDKYVVGQERAKKILSVAVYNHYQRIQELQRRDDEEEELLAQKERRERHPVEGTMTELCRERCLRETDELPGQQPTIRLGSPAGRTEQMRSPIVDPTPMTLDKSNILLLGPSGVGKTLMAKTLARVLEVPFSMSDCTPFTQAGYIGEDAEVCVHRLLTAANYDVARAERGIICLDEIDKIATARVSHGKDVSGEGVQQALLKIIEGTTIQIQAKPERNAPRAGGQSNTYPTSSPLGSSSFSQPSSTTTSSPAKGEVYNVRTDNILFIFTGAFTGLPKLVMDRISRNSMGFGNPVRSNSSLIYSSQSSSSAAANASQSANPIPILPGSEEEALYKKHLPYFHPPATIPTPSQDPHMPAAEPQYFNPLDLLAPPDLQTYGFIPEMIGRIPTTAALSPLTHSLLLRILTEPRSSLVSQYQTLFALSGIELRFTTPSLHVVASNALTMGTGARGLRTEMERILGDAMFEGPGSSVKYVLVTEGVAKREQAAVYFGRGQGSRFHGTAAQEEGAWEDKVRKEREEMEREQNSVDEGGKGSFEEWREKASAAGAGA